MKKQFAIITMLGILASMAGCGSSEKDNIAEKTTTSATTTEAASSTENTTAGKNGENTATAGTAKNGENTTTARNERTVKSAEITTKNDSIAKIAGVWYENYTEYPRIININSDGSYTVGAGEGTIWCENRNGIDWFNFIDVERGLWYSFQLLNINGEEMLVSEDNDMDDSYYFSRTKHEYVKDPNAPVANIYGMYPIIDPPVTSISVASLAGTWQNADDPSEVYTIYSTDDLYKGTFTCSYDGVVSIQGYVLYESTTPELSGITDYFSFYNIEGSLIEGFDVTGEIPLNDLYEKLYGNEHFVRIS